MKKSAASRSRFPLNPFLRALLAMSLPGAVLANPVGGVVVGGNAQISTPNTHTTVIDQSTHSAAINWQSFNVGGKEFVLFNQPRSSSVTLNRVVGGDASTILGHLSANGRVFLVNPAGVLFGAGATVDVGGLVASTLDISNENFLAGNYVFTQPAAHGGRVENAGTLSAADGGFVVLAGAEVRNGGLIQARLGEVALASGSALTLDFDGSGLVGYEITQGTLAAVAGVTNVGEILAQGGRVVMAANLARELIGAGVNNQGIVRAQGLYEDGGDIVLTASGGDVTQAGALDVSVANGHAAGAVEITTDRDITLTAGSTIDAAGASAGTVHVIAEQALSFESGATIDIARQSNLGRGGFAELSGRQRISIEGFVKLGSGGSLVFDPGGDFAIGGSDPELRDISEDALETILRLASRDSLVRVVGTRSVTLLDLEDGVLDGSSRDPGFGAGLLLGVGTTTNPQPGTDSVFTRGAEGSIRFADRRDTIRVSGPLILNTGTRSGTVKVGGLEATSIFIDSANDLRTGNLRSAGSVDLLTHDGQLRAGDIALGGDSLSITSINADVGDDADGGFVSGIRLGHVNGEGAVALETFDQDPGGSGLAAGDAGIRAADVSVSGDIFAEASTGDIRIADLKSATGNIFLRTTTGGIATDTLAAGAVLSLAAGQGDLRLVSVRAGNGINLSTGNGQISVGSLRVSGGGLFVFSNNADIGDDAGGGFVSGITLGDVRVPGAVILSTFDNDPGSSMLAGGGRGISTGDLSAQGSLLVIADGNPSRGSGDIALGSVRVNNAVGGLDGVRIDAQGGSVRTGAIGVSGRAPGITLNGADGVAVGGDLRIAGGGSASIVSKSGGVGVLRDIDLLGDLSINARGDVDLNSLRNLNGLNLTAGGSLVLAGGAVSVADDVDVNVGGDARLPDLESRNGSISVGAGNGIEAGNVSAAAILDVSTSRGNLDLVSASANDGMSLSTGDGRISVGAVTVTGGRLDVSSVNADVADDASAGFVSGVELGDVSVSGSVDLATRDDDPDASGAIGAGRGIRTGDISAQGALYVNARTSGDIDLGAIEDAPGGELGAQFFGGLVALGTLIDAAAGTVHTGAITLNGSSQLGSAFRRVRVFRGAQGVVIDGDLRVSDFGVSTTSIGSSSGSVRVNGTVATDGDFTASAFSDLTLSGLDVAGVTSLFAGGHAIINQANGDLFIDALSAGSANLLAADGRIEVVDFTADSGDAILTSINADVADDAGGGHVSGIRIGDLASGGNIDLRTQASDPSGSGLAGLDEGIHTGNLTANRSLNVSTQVGDIVLGTLAANESLRLDSAGAVSVANRSIEIEGGIEVSVGTGDLNLSKVSGNGVGLLADNGQVDVQAIDAGAGNLTVSSINADITDDATGPVSGIRLGEVADVGGSIQLNAFDVNVIDGATVGGRGIFTGSLSAHGSLSVFANSGDVQLGALSSGGDLSVFAQGGRVSLSDPRLSAQGTLSVTAAAGDLVFANVAGQTVNLFAGNGRIGIDALTAGSGGVVLISVNQDNTDDLADGPVSGISVARIASRGSVSLTADDNADPGSPNDSEEAARASGGPSGNITVGDIQVSPGLTSIDDPADADDISISASGLLTLDDSTVFGGSQITLRSGDLLLRNASLTGGAVEFAMQGPDADVSDGGLHSQIFADSLLVSGARNVLLGASDLSVGTGLTPAGTGDAVLLTELARRGLAPGVSVRPNAALLATDTLSLGSLSLTGNHVLLQGNELSFGEPGLVAPGGLLLQLLPGDPNARVSLENLRAQIGEVNFGVQNDFPSPGEGRSVVAIGGSSFDGDILVGRNGRVLPPPRTDLVLYTSGQVTEFQSISRDNGEVVIIGDLIRPRSPTQDAVDPVQAEVPPLGPPVIPIFVFPGDGLIEQETAEIGEEKVCQ